MANSEEIAEEIARVAKSHGLGIGVAESLTSGAIASALGAANEASEWFRGGVVAYASEVKFDLLGVTPGPVVSAECAEQMAIGSRRVLGADWTVAVTGTGGPGSEEGQPEGTVFFGVAGPDHTSVHHRILDGDPSEVVSDTVRLGLELLLSALRSGSATAPG